MNYYTRTTHIFDNDKRIWKPILTSNQIYEMQESDEFKKLKSAIKIHAFESGRWMNLREIVDANKKYATDPAFSHDFTEESYSEETILRDIEILKKFNLVRELSGEEFSKLMGYVNTI